MVRSTTFLRKDVLFRHIVHHVGSWPVMTLAVFTLVNLQGRDTRRSNPRCKWVDLRCERIRRWALPVPSSCSQLMGSSHIPGLYENG